MLKKNLNFKVILCEISLIFLCFFDLFSNLFLIHFGFSLFLLPFLFFISRKDITILIFALFLLFDFFFQVFPYKLCGMFGENLILINLKLFFLPSISFFIWFIYLLQKESYKVDSVFDLFDQKVEIKNENYSNLLTKLIEKYTMTIKIKRIEFGSIFSRYYIQIPKSTKFNRFISLSPDLTELMKLKVRNFCDLEYSVIEVENIKKTKLSFSEFKNNFQPNALFFKDCNLPFLLNLKNNFICLVNKEVIHSLIISILITKMNLDILLIGEDDVSFGVYNNLILNDPKMSYQAIIDEIERRHRLIIPLASDIYQYNKSNASLNFLVLIYKINSDLSNHIISFITQFGKQVGVFLIFYSEDFEKIEKYKNFFPIVLTSKVDNKKQSLELIDIFGAEFLTNEFDCILKHYEMITRVTVPQTTLEERVKVLQYLTNKNQKN